MTSLTKEGSPFDLFEQYVEQYFEELPMDDSEIVPTVDYSQIKTSRNGNRRLDILDGKKSGGSGSSKYSSNPSTFFTNS